MKKVATILLSSMVSGGIAFASGYYYSKNKYLKMADKEIESVKKTYEKYFVKKSPCEGGNSVNEDKKILTKSFPGLTTVTPSVVGNNDRLDYEKQYRGIEEQKKIISESHYNDASVRPDEKKFNVERISTEEFDMSSNSCRTLYYFEKDGYLTDIDNNIINNYADTIGSLTIVIDGFKNNESDVIYLRNVDVEIDYEICRVYDRWEDVASPSQKALMLDVNERKHD